MKKRFLLLLLLFMFLLTTVTFFLIWNYLDPYEFPLLGTLLLGFTFLLGVSSFGAFVLYFIKKIYFRGKVYVQNIISSFRQGFFIALFVVLSIYFHSLGASLYVVGLPLAIVLLFGELFLQNIQN